MKKKRPMGHIAHLSYNSCIWAFKGYCSVWPLVKYPHFKSTYIKRSTYIRAYRYIFSRNYLLVIVIFKISNKCVINIYSFEYFNCFNTKSF